MAAGISEKQQRGRPFVKGQSGNPSGRPPGAEGLAAQIRAKTNNGLEMIELMLEVMRDTSRSIDRRLEAATWLTDRGFGKPAQTVEHGGLSDQPAVVKLVWGDVGAQ